MVLGLNVNVHGVDEHLELDLVVVKHLVGRGTELREMLEVADELCFHFVDGDVLAFEHAFIDFGSDVGKEGLLVFHDSGHDVSRDIRWEYHLDAINFLKNIVFDFFVFHGFGIFLN